jgi:ADP-heptose:LPS heptosyltransferase
MRILVSGSHADAPVTEAIARENEHAISIAGQTGIGAFGALARRAQAFVGITTGSMHVAAAVGCPTVGIFPFQSDFPERWAPLGRRTKVVRASYPCHAGDTKERCPDYACIAHLDVPRIQAAVDALLA